MRKNFLLFSKQPSVQYFVIAICVGKDTEFREGKEEKRVRNCMGEGLIAGREESQLGAWSQREKKFLC